MKDWMRRGGFAAFYLLLALVQLGPLVSGRPEAGTWFLDGRDTTSHDAIAQIWAFDAVRQGAGTLPLWCPGLRGGLPTLGSFLWTPFAPTLWAHLVFSFPVAQRLQFVLALAWAACGAHLAARRFGLSREAAVLAGVGFGFSGHLVTLIHAGHLQKILALAWLPWFAAGLPLLAQGCLPLSCSLALGMAMLSGHPQIAWLMMAMGLAWALSGGNRRMRLLLMVLAIGAGLALGSAQMLPGMEMARWSNRAHGVSFEEATETSYPPGELLELLLPRFLGDSSAFGDNHYAGRWGERLVSDYAGGTVWLLAFISLAAARRPGHRYWMALGLTSLVVGLGRYTPVYSALYHLAPGFSSFRSPGTFMAGAALALPLLAAMGFDAARQRPRLVPWGAGALAIILLAAWACPVGFLGALASDAAFATGTRAEAIVRTGLFVFLAALFVIGTLGAPRWLRGGLLALLLAIDLLGANKAFLGAVPWEGGYEAYLAPGSLEVALADIPAPRRLIEPGREMSLRPLVNDRDALLGYHPVSFALFDEFLRREGFDSAAFRDQWAVLDRGAPVSVLREQSTKSPVPFRWEKRTPDHAIARITGLVTSPIELAEMDCPGWRLFADGEELPPIKAPNLVRTFPPARKIEMRYEPFSYRCGLFLSLLAAAALVAWRVGAACREPVLVPRDPIA